LDIAIVIVGDAGSGFEVGGVDFDRQVSLS
jgi:hypothetical protein